ncbi:MAG: MCP four helix bundle domain-containing protein, partial [Deltaproteobacteria bacterium]|nr:MCP four helix bundle domain-containing protein [Deltaproteobacteria bacterium]
MMLKDARLSVKLIGGFLFVAIVTLVIGFLGWQGAYRLSSDIDEIGNVRLPGIQNILTIRIAMEEKIKAQRTLLNLYLDEGVRGQQIEAIGRAREVYQKEMESYGSLPKSVQEEKVWKQFVKAATEDRGEEEEFLNLYKKLEENDILNPLGFRKEVEMFKGEILTLMNQTLDYLQTGNDFAGEDDADVTAFGKWLSTFTTKNTTIVEILRAIGPLHKELYEKVNALKEYMWNDSYKEAAAVYSNEMFPIKKEIFRQFEILLQEAAFAEDLYNKLNEQSMVIAYEKQRAATDLLKKIIEINQTIVGDTQRNASAQARLIKWGTMVCMMIGFAVALAIGIVLSLSVTRTLNRIIDGLTRGAEQVASASHQVSQSSQQMAEGSSEQASSLE